MPLAHVVYENQVFFLTNFLSTLIVYEPLVIIDSKELK